MTTKDKQTEATMLLKKLEAADRLRISPQTLDRHISNGLIHPCRVGKLILFTEKELERFITACERPVRPRETNHHLAVS